MDNKKLRAALKYHEMKFSIIPTGQDKKPLVKWTKYQTQRADKKQIEAWWKRWSDANPAVVTGKNSGINILDVDTKEGWENLNENYLDESFLTPISKTPGGGYHVVFDYQPGLSNGVRVLPGCDLRTDGGYAILPPSDNGKGKAYAWLPDLNPLKVKPVPMPDFLFSVLAEAPAAGYASALKREHINKVPSYNKKTSLYKGPNIGPKSRQPNKPLQNLTRPNIGFNEGQRDDSLFHLVWYLQKAGMPQQEIEIYVNFIARNCNPPFPEKEIAAKIKSALDRSKRKKSNLTQQIRDYINLTKGNISITNTINSLQTLTFEDRATVHVIFSRLVKEGVLKRVENQVGVYRIVDDKCEPENWQDACTDTVEIWLPFGLDKIAMVPPGSIITIAGEPNSGKTATLLNIAKENRDDWTIHYFSSETGPGAFKRRIDKFKDITPDQFNINFYQRSDNFADVIKPGDGNLNIVDFLELYSDFYLVSKHLADIHKKLDSAIAIVALQKSPGQITGRGGSFSIEKPVLSLALSPGVAKIAKLKEWQAEFNPNRMQYHFKLVDGCRFIKTQGWHHPIE